MPQPGNAGVLPLPPYNLPRKGKRITHAQEGDWRMGTMELVKRQETRRVVFGLALAM